MIDSDKVFDRALSLAFVGFMLLFAYAAYMLIRRIKELEKQHL